MMKVDWKILLFSVVLCELIGNIGTVFTIPALSGWYISLNKAPFNPPNWIFGPVWTILYALMGIAAYLILSKGFKKPAVKTALYIFSTQLALNVLWSVVFFGLRSPFYGMVAIILMWIAILATILKFYGISRTAGYVMIPYILWVSFAAVLNYYVFILN